MKVGTGPARAWQELHSHPVLASSLCLNRRQRSHVCTKCMDICPHGVFPVLSGEPLHWEKCTDCGLCVAACPSRALSASELAFRQWEEALKGGRVRVTCPSSPGLGDIPVRCLASVPWELLAAFALKGGLVLGMQGCKGCEKARQKELLAENLGRLRIFLGEEGFSCRVTLLGETDDLPSGDEGTEGEEKSFSRKGLLAGVGKSLAKRLAQKAGECLPYAQEPLKVRRWLAGAVDEVRGQEKKEGKHPSTYGMLLPRITTACYGCGICERVCPHQAIRFVKDEGEESRLFLIDSLRCTSCSLCIWLCPHGGADALLPVQGPYLGEVPLVRVKSGSCLGCANPIPWGQDSPYCFTCARRMKKRGRVNGPVPVKGDQEGPGEGAKENPSEGERRRPRCRWSKDPCEESHEGG